MTEYVYTGDEHGVQGRLNERTGQALSLVTQVQGLDFRFRGLHMRVNHLYEDAELYHLETPKRYRSGCAVTKDEDGNLDISMINHPEAAHPCDGLADLYTARS